MNKQLRKIYEMARMRANTILQNRHQKEYREIAKKTYNKMLKELLKGGNKKNE